VTQAVAAARKSVDFADRSGDAFQKYALRTTLADALHQTGGGDDMAEAETLFREAEEMQKKHTPEYPYLYALAGYYFCDLLLGQGQYAEVQKQAEETIKIAIENKWLLHIAMDHLSLGRAHFLQALDQGKRDFKKALGSLHRAVDGLRESGRQDLIPLGLFARAAVFRSSKDFKRAWDDLEETREIAERGNMNLFMADYHLEAARLSYAQEKNEEAKKHLETAKQMINKMGYHRRKPEVEELEGLIG
jgi:tetratricopeptide (TPR) repeat protein